MYPACLDRGEILTPGRIDVEGIVHAFFHSPRGDMLLNFCIFLEFF